MSWVDPERLSRLLVAVVLGGDRDQVCRSDAERAAWDRLTVQVADIRAAGGSVAIPND